MPEATKKPRRRTRAQAEQAEESVGNGRVEEAPERAQQEADEQPDGGEQGGEEQRGGEDTVFSELRGVIRDAALEVLKPVAREATTSAAKFAVAKGPDLVKSKVAPKVMEAGGAGALAKGALEKGGGVAGGLTEKAGGLTEKFGKKGGGKKPTGHGRGRRLPVQESIDVAVDIQTAYDQWTQFEDFPNFMHRVEKVEQRDDETVMWHENIWGVRRSWEAEIVEQKPCERIVWRSTSGTQTVGVVTFHRLSDRLTRVQVNLDFQPQGLFEKTASGMRLSRRALRSDLMRFKAFIEMKDEPTGAWRGEIEEGEVVDDGSQDGGEERDEEREEPQGEEDDEPTAEEEDEEPSAEEEDEEPSAEEEDEEPSAEEDEDFEEEPSAEEDEEPVAEDEDYEEPAAEEEEEYEEEPEEEEEEKPKKPARRRRATATSKRR